MSEQLHPDFPVVSGRYALTNEWSVELPIEFNRRIEEGSLVLWRPRFTIWINVWNNDHGESTESRMSWMKAGRSPDARDIEEDVGGGFGRISYRLAEDGVEALYGLVVAESGHLQLALYFDDESDVAMARDILDSVEGPPGHGGVSSGRVQETFREDWI